MSIQRVFVVALLACFAVACVQSAAAPEASSLEQFLAQESQLEQPLNLEMLNSMAQLPSIMEAPKAEKQISVLETSAKAKAKSTESRPRPVRTNAYLNRIDNHLKKMFNLEVKIGKFLLAAENRELQLEAMKNMRLKQLMAAKYRRQRYPRFLEQRDDTDMLDDASLLEESVSTADDHISSLSNWMQSPRRANRRNVPKVMVLNHLLRQARQLMESMEE